MNILFRNPKLTFALLTSATAFLTILYARVQIDQQSCDAIENRAMLTEIRSEVGLLQSSFSLTDIEGKIATLDRNQIVRVPTPRGDGIHTLGELASEHIALRDELEKSRKALLKNYLDQVRNDIEVKNNHAGIMSECLPEFDYSVLLLIAQVLLTSLSGMVGFVAGSGLARNDEINPPASPATPPAT